MRLLILPLILLLSSFAFAKTIKLNPNNTLVINTPIYPEWSVVALEKLNRLVRLRGSSKTPLYIFIASPGGYLDELKSFVDKAKTVENLHTISLVSISAAAFLVEFLPGSRFMVPEGGFLFHQIRYAFPAGRDLLLKDLEEAIEELKKDAGIYQIIADRIKMPISEYNKRTEEDWIIRGSENLKLNIIDEIVDVECESGGPGFVSPNLSRIVQNELIIKYINCLTL